MTYLCGYKWPGHGSNHKTVKTSQAWASMCSKTFKSFECYQTNVICVIFSQVQDAYYGQQEARIGHFPSSIVEETHALMPATTEVKTTVGEHTHMHMCI